MLAIIFVISKSPHSTFMLCTALTLLYAFVYYVKLAFLLIPAITCSYMPCRYSCHVILASLFRKFDQPPRTPLAMILINKISRVSTLS